MTIALGFALRPHLCGFGRVFPVGVDEIHANIIRDGFVLRVDPNGILFVSAHLFRVLRGPCLIR